MAIKRIVAHWRDSGRSPRFLGIDARCTLPLLLFFCHIAWWTFFWTLSVTLFFGLLERFGFTARVFLRMVRSILAGPRVVAKPWWREDTPR
jgi:intracellular multiplication protein IcmT